MNAFEMDNEAKKATHNNTMAIAEL